MKGKSWLGLILTLLIIALSVYTAVIGFGDKHVGGAKDVNLGLDLAGGVSITYSTVKDNPTDQEISDTIYKLQKRLDEKGYGEYEVYKEGNDRINIDIPGVSDANKVLQELGKPGRLEFKDESGNIIITGSDVKNAYYQYNPKDITSPHNIVLELNDSGIEKFSQGTLANIGKTISIFYNDQLLMSPGVDEQITGGVASISHMKSEQEGKDMATNIRIGALPLELQELRSNVVGAKLGQDAIHTSLIAGFIGIIAVFIFMIAFYRLPGLAASLALLFYTTLTMICVSLFNIVLTLPGIAGVLLSIGMAVDANVIIFSRIREELGMEKTLKASIKSGFKKALSAIIDGNITTFIAAVVLYIMGTGPLKGFAITLGLGIIISMFTALGVCRLIMNLFVGIGLTNKKLYGVTTDVRMFKFIEKRRIWFIVSIVVIGIGFAKLPINLATRGTLMVESIDFAGGTSTVVSLPEGEGYTSSDALSNDVTSLVVEATGDNTPQLQYVKGKDQFIIKTLTLETDQRVKLEEALTAKFGITTDDIETQSISGTIGKEMTRDAIISILVVALAILIYVAIRFKDFKFGFAAVVALAHDISVMVAYYALFNVAIDNSFIAAILTILGFSINDTIVIFDRIRENQRHMKRGDYIGVINTSVSQTLSRSINTSITTLFMVILLVFIGVESIKVFAKPLIIGMISGVYSTVFIASPIWYLLKRREDRKLGHTTQE